MCPGCGEWRLIACAETLRVRRVLPDVDVAPNADVTNGGTAHKSEPQFADERTTGCRGVVRGAEVPLTGSLRATVIELFAAALVADFLGDSARDGQFPEGN